MMEVDDTFPLTHEAHRDHCRALQAELLENRALIIASNRAPVTFEQDQDGDLTFQRGGGGLVTALTDLCRHTDATWIACAQNEADSAWGAGSIPLPDDGSVRVQFLSPEPAAYDGYYNVIANPLLWFLQHSMWDIPRAPVINRATWDAWEDGYVTVNRLFAKAIAAQVLASSRPTLVMLQDYHLYLVARFLREALRPAQRPPILHFIHIPWPGPEYWRILPPTMRWDILDGLCAVDVLGFQTADDGLNFIRTCETHLPRSHVAYRRGRIWYRNHATHIHDFPISIDVEALRQTAASQEVADYQDEIKGLVQDRSLILRIDRTEPSKNIIRGFQAFGEMLDLYPEYVEQVTFLALLVPSRIQVDEYKDYLDELMGAAGWVNANYGTSEWEPIRILVGENYPRAIAAMQLYDVLLVNAIADGMNLVAKEGPIVNQRDGVLILSERAGARQQLEPGALVISPTDVYATAEAMHQALGMSPKERAERSERLRWLIEREDIDVWLCQQLEAAASLDVWKKQASELPPQGGRSDASADST
jgi:trehalose 6-phosphate synthase